MLTHVPGYNVTTDSIRSKTVKDSYVKWDAGVLVNAVTTTNSSLTLDNSHDSFYINNANASTISVTILNTINDYTANSNNSLRRVNVIIDSRSAASDRTVTFTIPSTFTLLGGLSATRNLYHGNLQVFVVEIVNNTVNIYDGVGSYFETDSNGDLMPLNSSADLVPRTDLTGQLGTGDKRWAAVYAGNITNTYDSVADMISDTSLKEGGTAFTKGYYNPNDGGAGVYNIRVCGSGEPESCDNGSTIFLTNGNVAELIDNEPTLNVAKFGLVDGEYINDYWDAILNYCVSTNKTISFNPVTYHLRKTDGQNYGVTGRFVSMDGHKAKIYCDNTFTASDDAFLLGQCLHNYNSFIRNIDFFADDPTTVRYYLNFTFPNMASMMYRLDVEKNRFRPHASYAIYSYGMQDLDYNNGGFNNCNFQHNIVYGLFMKMDWFGDSNNIISNSLYGDMSNNLNAPVMDITIGPSSANLYVAFNNCSSGLGRFNTVLDGIFEGNQIENVAQTWNGMYCLEIINGQDVLVLNNNINAHGNSPCVYLAGYGNEIRGGKLYSPKSGSYAIDCGNTNHMLMINNIVFFDRNYSNDLQYLLPSSYFNGKGTNVEYDDEHRTFYVDSAFDVHVKLKDTATTTISPYLMRGEFPVTKMLEYESDNTTPLTVSMPTRYQFKASAVPKTYITMPIIKN